jgi:hypothetical protein
MAGVNSTGVKSRAMKTSTLLLLASGLGLAVYAAAAAAPLSSSPAPTKTALLDHEETDYRLLSRGLSIKSRSQPFGKEPAPGKGVVHRGRLVLGAAVSNAVSFLWLAEERRLHLDLNHNEDFTDDKAGVFQGHGEVRSQTFTNVWLPFETASGVHRFKLEIALSAYGSGMFYANVGVQSCWRGRFTWGSQEVELALIEGPWGDRSAQTGPFLVLRPWARHGERIALEQGTADAIALPKVLHWQDLSYELSRRFETEAGVERCRLEFTEQKPALGGIKINGALLNRLVLESEHGYTVVLDTPATEARGPLGTYKLSGIWVKNDGAEARAASTRQVKVTDQSPTLLSAGGPLTNSVSIQRRGKFLVLSYQLVGLDGGTYQLQNEDRSNPPEARIFYKGKQLAAGKFAYG